MYTLQKLDFIGGKVPDCYIVRDRNGDDVTVIKNGYYLRRNGFVVGIFAKHSKGGYIRYAIGNDVIFRENPYFSYFRTLNDIKNRYDIGK